MDEFERIEAIRRRLAMPAPGVVLGIGDDAAILKGDSRDLVWTVDSQVEGVHFRTDLLSATDIGYRALTAALSDLAAMGATPRACLCAMTLPSQLEDATLMSIADGVAEAARDYKAPVIGGNLAAAPTLSLTTTALGHAPRTLLTRAGAQPGDSLHVTGSVGAAALGLMLLQRDEAGRSDSCVLRWRRPTARIAEGISLCGVASAAIDVSDGLLQDLQHLCSASGVSAQIELDAIPVPEELDLLSRELGVEPLALALGGGEDYELLFSVPAGTTVPIEATRIGRITQAGSSIRLMNADGKLVAAPAAGFKHF